MSFVVQNFDLMKQKVLDYVYMNEAYSILRIKLSSGLKCVMHLMTKPFYWKKVVNWWIRSAKKLQPAVLLHKIGHVFYSYCRTLLPLHPYDIQHKLPSKMHTYAF